MSNYIGVRCPVCNKKFTEADDIVVCPVCGAPHHRSCYAETKQCAFVEDHLSGKEWHDPNGQVPPYEQETAGGTKTCTRCGTVNKSDSLFCETCGYPMTLPEHQAARHEAPGEAPYQWFGMGEFGTQVNAISMAYGGLKPEDEIDGEPVKELAKYVGAGSAYYLPRFRVMSEYDRSFMPNFFAFLFSFYYFFYRKMYAVGFLLLAVTVVSVIPESLYTIQVVMPVLFQQFKDAAPDIFQWLGTIGPAEVNQAAAEHYTMVVHIARTVRLVIVLIFSLFANRMYYNKSIAAVHSIHSGRAESATDDEYYETLARTGGTSKTAVIVSVSVMFLAQAVLYVMITYMG
jgi:hypothetical protein